MRSIKVNVFEKNIIRDTTREISGIAQVNSRGRIKKIKFNLEDDDLEEKGGSFFSSEMLEEICDNFKIDNVSAPIDFYIVNTTFEEEGKTICYIVANAFTHSKGDYDNGCTKILSEILAYSQIAMTKNVAPNVRKRTLIHIANALDILEQRFLVQGFKIDNVNMKQIIFNLLERVSGCNIGDLPQVACWSLFMETFDN